MRPKMNGANGAPQEGTYYLFGVRVDNTRCESALERIRAYATQRVGSRAREVFFTNVHSIHLARHDPELRQCINHADLVLADGSGLNLAGKLFGSPIIENLNGTDFTPKVLSEALRNGWTVYLLGAAENVVRRCRDRLLKEFPGLKIAGFHHGHFPPAEEGSIVEEINRKRPNILLVALGSPLQERWIARHARELRVGVCVAVGGLFDFISGARTRAPHWVRALGIEWIYRFLQDPKSKWDRVVIEIPSFIGQLLLNRFALRKVKPAWVRRRFS
jgi:N-acetylglucosaminyldiphosphoundecaprenol N-acetyl-beta-D-mannosaminyltransferase